MANSHTHTHTYNIVVEQEADGKGTWDIWSEFQTSWSLLENQMNRCV